MEAHRHFLKTGSAGRNPGLSSRRNSILVAAVSAVLAAALIFLFVTHYRKTPAPVAPAEVTVWVAKQPIPLGTTEAAAAAAGLLVPKHVPSTQAAFNAITDPSAITGDAAAVPIEKGQQITSNDFARSTAPAVSATLTGTERAVGFSFDSEHGLTTFLHVGDLVDVMGVTGSGSSEMIAQKVMVLSDQNGVVVLRLSDRQALLVTAATGVSSLWLSLRPTINAQDSVPVGSVGR